MTAPGPRSEHFLGVLGQSGGDPAVLLAPDGAAWTLPRLTSEDRASSEVAELTRDARALLGADVSVLQCLADTPATAGQPRRQLYALEAHGERWTPPAGLEWITAAELKRVAFSPPELAAALAAWLDERAAGRFSARNREWVQPGWRDQALAWVDDVLAARGLGRIADVEQLKVWEYSHVLRLRGTRGVFYLKALCESAAREPGLTARLARAHPGWVPDVVGIDVDRRWLLMRATAGPELSQGSDGAAWEEAARRCARIQIAWVDRTAELHALGLPHWPLDAVARQIAPMLADGAALQVTTAEGLTDDELAELRRLAPDLGEQCRELAGLGVPDSLEHGDLWGTNVILAANGPVLIDWEDSTVAHPFLSPSLLLLTLPYAPAAAGAAEMPGRIRDAYLAEWHAASPLRGWPAARLERAFDLAQRAAMVHYAVQFWLGTAPVSRVPIIETSWWVRTFAPFFLRRCLA